MRFAPSSYQIIALQATYAIQGKNVNAWDDVWIPDGALYLSMEHDFLLGWFTSCRTSSNSEYASQSLVIEVISDVCTS